MAKRKYPSELNTRTVRVNIGDWQLLMEISRRSGIAVAETFHKLIKQYLVPGLPPERETERREQMSMIPTPVFRIAPITSIVVNGNKRVAFKIKPKGGVFRE